MAEQFLIRFQDGPFKCDRFSTEQTWPLPDAIGAPGGTYVKVAESQLTEPHPNILRGAAYEWVPETEPV